MTLTQLAVKRPVTNLMLLILLVFLGVMFNENISTTLLPDIEFEFLFVYATLEHTPPQSMLVMLTEPLEDAVRLLPSVTKYRSNTRTNDVVIFVELESGTDVLSAKTTLEDNIARMELPAKAQYFVYHFDPQEIPILSMDIESEGDLSAVRTLVDDFIKPEISRIKGVGKLEIQGGHEWEIVIKLNERALKRYNLGLGEIFFQLLKENVVTQGGRVKQGHQEVVVRVQSQLAGIPDIENTIVKVLPNKKPIRVKDIGYVYQDFADTGYIYRFNGRESLMIDIYKKSNANTLELSEQIKQKCREFEKRFAINIQYFNDSSATINRVLDSIQSDLLKGLIFASLVLLIFLRTFRSVITIMFTVPVCVIITFIPMYFTGVNVNLISLLGFALVSGMLVDNSIVIMENIHRYRTMGYSAIQASVLGTDEVRRPIFTSTLTSIAVFFPIFLIGGMASKIFHDLSFTAMFSLFSSYFVAMSVVPMFTSHFHLAGNSHEGFRFINRIFGAKPFMFISRSMTAFYAAGNRMIQRKWYTKLGFILAVIFMLIIGFIFSAINADEQQIEDRKYLSLQIEAYKGTKMQEIDKVMLLMEEYMDKHIADIKNISSVSRKGVGYFYLELYEKAEMRKRFGLQRQRIEDILDTMHREFDALPGIRIISRTRSYGGNQDEHKSIINIVGRDITILRDIALKSVKRLKTLDFVLEANTDFGAIGSELMARPDKTKLASYGLTSQDIASVLQRELGGDIATEIYSEGDKKNIRIMVDQQRTRNIDTLKDLTIRLPSGQYIPITEVVSFTMVPETSNLIRENGEFISAIEFKTKGDVPMTKMMEKVTNREKTGVLDDIYLPQGYFFDWSGRVRSYNESMADLYIFFLAGLVLVFMIMAAEFESLFHPFVIMFTVPLAVFGGILGLKLMSIHFSTNAAMGLIILIGIVVNDAIILIDFINKERKRGKDRVDAIISAGLVRMRPIFMTTLTTVGAMIPLLFGMEEGSEYKRPMAAIIIGGLTFASFLTLYFIPSLYSFLEDVVDLFRFIKMRIMVVLRFTRKNRKKQKH